MHGLSLFGLDLFRNVTFRTSFPITQSCKEISADMCKLLASKQNDTTAWSHVEANIYHSIIKTMWNLFFLLLRTYVLIFWKEAIYQVYWDKYQYLYISSEVRLSMTFIMIHTLAIYVCFRKVTILRHESIENAFVKALL